jgi:hypothetical protein
VKPLCREQEQEVGDAFHRSLGFHDRRLGSKPCPAVRDGEEEQGELRVFHSEPTDAGLLDDAFLMPHINTENP